MKAASESARYDYGLRPDSVVMNVGAYHGHFAKEFAQRYNCRILAFEPISSHYYIAQETLKGFPKVELYHFGLGSTSRVEEFGVSNDSSGLWSHAPIRENVQIRGLRETMDSVDLLELNCEGGEFEIIPEIIRLGWQHRFKQIQVQVHFNHTNAEAEWALIHDALSATHLRTWGGDFTYWTNYRLIHS
jgi:FkbM family methyltransferase